MQSTPDNQSLFDKELIDRDARALMVRIAVFFNRRAVRAYLVGGFIRDALLGRDTRDIDLAVDTDILQTGMLLAEELQGKFVLLDDENGVGRIILNDWTIDLAAFSGKIEDDLTRRDFTINAMAVDLQELTSGRKAILIDPLRGQPDLDDSIIRTVTDHAFSDDPVRLLRAFRLATELDFDLEHKTEDQLTEAVALIAGVPGERIREELLRVLNQSHGGQVFRDMDGMGLLTALIPELTPMKGVEQPKEHHWDVFHHSLKTVDAADFVLHHGFWEYQNEDLLAKIPWTDVIAAHFAQSVSSGSNRRSLVKLAALLHDICKPQTKTFDENGKMRFLGHPESGAEVVQKIMERLRFSAKETKLVTLMTRYHMRPTQTSHDGMPTARAIYRYFRDTGDAGIDTLYLSLADHLATRGPGLLPDQWEYHTQLVAHVLEEHFKQKKQEPIKLVDGNDLMNLFGMKPGAKMGDLLEAIREAQAAGEITTRDEALEFVKKYLSSH
jgi:poly(A) polymerase